MAEPPKLERDLIDGAAKILRFFGLDSAASVILATLLIAESPLSKSEIGERSGYGMSSVNLNLIILVRIGAVSMCTHFPKEKTFAPAMSLSSVSDMLVKDLCETNIIPVITQLERAQSTAHADKRKRFRQLALDYRKLLKRLLGPERQTALIS